jgi:enamine deaminase RidA (YjgF/YER057c/UK114 family)
VVKVNTYVVNYRPADYPIIREARARIFVGHNPPASTLIGVQSLAVEELLIEIEAIAVVE